MSFMKYLLKPTSKLTEVGVFRRAQKMNRPFCAAEASVEIVMAGCLRDLAIMCIEFGKFVFREDIFKSVIEMNQHGRRASFLHSRELSL